MDAQSESCEPPPCDPQPPGKIRKALKLFSKRKPGSGMASIFSMRSKGEGGPKSPPLRSETLDGLTETVAQEAEAESVDLDQEDSQRGDVQIEGKQGNLESTPTRQSISSITSAKSLSFLNMLRRSQKGGGGDRQAQTESQRLGRQRKGLKGLFGSVRWHGKDKEGGDEAPSGPPLLASRSNSVEIIKENLTLTPRPAPRSADASETEQQPPAPQDEQSSSEDTTKVSESAKPPTNDRLSTLLGDISSILSFDSLTGGGDIVADVEAEWVKVSCRVEETESTDGTTKKDKALLDTVSSKLKTSLSPTSTHSSTCSTKPSPVAKPISYSATSPKPMPSPTTKLSHSLASTPSFSTSAKPAPSLTSASTPSPITKPAPSPAPSPPCISSIQPTAETIAKPIEPPPTTPISTISMKYPTPMSTPALEPLTRSTHAPTPIPEPATTPILTPTPAPETATKSSTTPPPASSPNPATPSPPAISPTGTSPTELVASTAVMGEPTPNTITKAVLTPAPTPIIKASYSAVKETKHSSATKYPPFSTSTKPTPSAPVTRPKIVTTFGLSTSRNTAPIVKPETKQPTPPSQADKNGFMSNITNASSSETGPLHNAKPPPAVSPPPYVPPMSKQQSAASITISKHVSETAAPHLTSGNVPATSVKLTHKSEPPVPRGEKEQDDMGSRRPQKAETQSAHHDHLPVTAHKPEKKILAVKPTALSKIPVSGGGRPKHHHTQSNGDEGHWNLPTPVQDEESPTCLLRESSSKDALSDYSTGSGSITPTMSHSHEDFMDSGDRPVMGATSIPRESKIPMKPGSTATYHSLQGKTEAARSKIPVSKVPVRRPSNKPATTATAAAPRK